MIRTWEAARPGGVLAEHMFARATADSLAQSDRRHWIPTVCLKDRFGEHRLAVSGVHLMFR